MKKYIPFIAGVAGAISIYATIKIMAHGFQKIYENHNGSGALCLQAL